MYLNGTGVLGDRWGAESSPSGFDAAYMQSSESIAPGIVDYAQSIKTASMSIIDALSYARNSVSMTDQQRDLLSVQLDRARQGLPPLNTSVYGIGAQQNQMGAFFAQNQGMILLIVGAIIVALMMRDKGK